MKQVTRTVTTTIIKLVEIHLMKDGKVETTKLPDIWLSGKTLTKEQANKAAKKQYKDKHILVTDVLIEENVYGLDLDAFVELATIVTKDCDYNVTIPVESEVL